MVVCNKFSTILFPEGGIMTTIGTAVSDLISTEQQCLVSLQDHIANLIVQKGKAVSSVEKRRLQKIQDEAQAAYDFLEKHIKVLFKIPRGRLQGSVSSPYPQA